MKNYKLFIDMDGVLCNFIGGVCHLFDEDPLTANRWGFYEDWGYTESEFWAKIDEVGEDFWMFLPTFDHTTELLELAHKLDKYFYICTSPSKSPSCYSGKIKWLERYVNKVNSRAIIIKNKWELAKPGRVLVDDKFQNIAAWRNKKGIDLWWPEQTNNCQLTIPGAFKQLEKIFE